MRLATTRTLEYGLPVSVHDLFRSYDPREESQTNSETQTTQSSESILIGLVFAMCLVGLVVLNASWSRATSSP